MGGPLTVGIDVGATKVDVAAVDADGVVVAREARVRTPDATTERIVEPLVAAVERIRETCADVVAVGIGTAGIVHWPEGEVEFAANHGHDRLPLRQHLESGCGLPVVVENDANAAAWAEAANQPDGAVLFLAIGTGLGSGFVMDGRLMRGHRGRGAELGHIVVDRSSTERCACGRVGCLEVLASGRALRAAGERIADEHPDGVLAHRIRGTERLTTSTVIDAARDGDTNVRAVVATMGRHLGHALSGVMSLLPVDRVAVGGGLAALGSTLLVPMQVACDEDVSASNYLSSPRIHLATHGSDATLVGAALLAGQAAKEPTTAHRAVTGQALSTGHERVLA